MRFTTAIASVLALGAMTTAAPVPLDTSLAVPANNIIARNPEPAGGFLGMFAKFAKKPKPAAKPVPAATPLQSSLGLNGNGQHWLRTGAAPGANPLQTKLGLNANGQHWLRKGT